MIDHISIAIRYLAAGAAFYGRGFAPLALPGWLTEVPPWVLAKTPRILA
jgi:hypothetical protein